MALSELKGNDLQLLHLRSDALSVSIMQDASAGWLAIRFGSCGDDLVRNYGAIGVGRFSGQCHAMKIRELTERALSNFCCPTTKMPCSSQKRKPNLILVTGSVHQKGRPGP